MTDKSYDFSGWASRYDTLCSDGRTIHKGAFADMDGMVVPLVWGHEHGSPTAVLGNALIEHRDEGPYIYGSFNDSTEGQAAKEAVRHHDVRYLSIYANNLKQQAKEVMHGVIREVSLVYGGANPKAFIDNAVLAHSDGTFDLAEDEAVIHFPEEILVHSEEAPKGDGKEKSTDMADTDEQKNVVYFMISEAIKNAKGGSDEDEEDDDDEAEHSEEGGNYMKYNAFEDDARSRSNIISHSDQMGILEAAKDNRVGTFKNALNEYLSENFIQHDDSASPVAGFDDTDLIDNVYTSFTAILPEYKDLRPGAPELVTNDQGWITTVMSKVHKSPISRIRTGQVDIRNAEQLRAKGYVKGQKKAYTGNIKLARRTTDPQTIYVKNALHRDDIVDITDFDYVQYLYNIDRMMLNEELATAIMLGDGREDSDPDKIFPEHIRPIWTDDELYVIHKDLDLEAMANELQGRETGGSFGENYIAAEAMIQTLLYAREDFKGTGTPDLFITPHFLNVMLLSKDMNGRRIFSSKSELATSLNVGSIFTAEQFANKTRKVVVNGVERTKQLVAICLNLKPGLPELLLAFTQRSLLRKTLPSK